MTDRGLTLHLSSAGLLSKWGFGDGDMPEHVLDRIDELGIRYEDVDWDATLRKLVRTYLLPELRKHHAVEVYDIDTNHNPIRASTVDGIDIDDAASNHAVRLTPEYVQVPMDEVIAAIRTTS